MLKQAIKTKWLEELRNGGHEQVPGTLKGIKPDGTIGYCCLGVLEEKVLGNQVDAVKLIGFDEDIGVEYEGDYVKDWQSDELPFGYKGVDSYGGEDQGSDFYSVILIRNPDDHDEQYYIKFQGWYASYDGAEYHNWSFVEPKQKTITIYS